MLKNDNVLDRSLARRLKERDPQALAEVYDRYGRLLYCLIYRIVRDRTMAEDLTQETMLRIWNRVSGFDESRASLTTWMAKIARNQAIDYLRSRAGRETVPVEIEGMPAVSADFEEELDAGRRLDFLRKGFRLLTAEQKLVLRLAYFGGLTQSEISQHVDRPLGTVKTWVRAALKTLRAEASCLSPSE